jgi:hypothetical protein
MLRYNSCLLALKFPDVLIMDDQMSNSRAGTSPVHVMSLRNMKWIRDSSILAEIHFSLATFSSCLLLMKIAILGSSYGLKCFQLLSR